MVENGEAAPRQQPAEEEGNAADSVMTPFSGLSQEEADLALARRLQEQERAYMMLRMSSGVFGSVGGSYDEEDDEYDDDEYDDDEDDDDLGVNFDPEVFTSDEAYAREMAARLFAIAGIHDLTGREDRSGNSQELIALGDVVGTESRGLSADAIASLPSINYKSGSSLNGTNDSCVVCRMDFENGETLTLLSCKHSYHSECINNWLNINKVCPVCSTEVSTSGHS